MPEMKYSHDPQFTRLVEEAHRFTSEKLGLSIVPREYVGVLGTEEAEAWRGNILPASQGGGFDATTGKVVVLERSDPGRPKTSQATLGSHIVHELTHSGTYTEGEHAFYFEALAGIGEHKYLDWLRNNGRFEPAVSFLLQRAGVELVIPGTFRQVHATESLDLPMNGPVGARSTQGLIAGLGVAHTLLASGIKSADILGASKINGTAQYEVMKNSTESLKPGLTKEIESLPQTTEGIIQATSMIQGEALKQGLFR